MIAGGATALQACGGDSTANPAAAAAGSGGGDATSSSSGHTSTTGSHTTTTSHGATGGGAQGGSDQGGSSAGGAGPGGSNQGGAGGAGGGVVTDCPATPVANRDPCTTPGQWCSWGDDPRYGCRVHAECGNNLRWDRTPPAGDEPCPPTVPTCPTTQMEFNQNCTGADLGLTCVFMDTAYTCTKCDGTLCFQQNQWNSTPLDAKCPDPLPNLGDACADEGLQCDYNSCADDQAMHEEWASGVPLTCLDGYWTFWNTMMACL
jgi:hypothetical protein